MTIHNGNKGDRTSVMELWVVRHGETDWNTAARVQGWTDVPLNGAGIQQARKLAWLLQGVPFKAVFTSDLTRARMTAEALQQSVAAPLHRDRRLRERQFGSAEGLTRTEMQMRFPAGIPDQEPLQALADRATAFLDEMTNTFHDGRVLCVSHGGLIRTLLKLAGQSDIPPLHNTSVSRLVWTGENWRAAAISSADHVPTATLD